MRLSVCILIVMSFFVYAQDALMHLRNSDILNRAQQHYGDEGYTRIKNWLSFIDSSQGKSEWQQIHLVNDFFNKHIQYQTDDDLWQKKDYWATPLESLGVGMGDCEDYVLLKRYHLIKAGIHPSNLLVTVVKQRNGDGHAVLTVRTDRGDFILDNLEGAVNDWRDTPYTYLKRQSSDHAGRWVTIEDGRKRLAQN